MTGHQINSLVGDLVAMAKAMERVPELEREINTLRNENEYKLGKIAEIEADLEQSRAYVVSLQAKFHEAEVAKDAAETMFLEADDKLGKVAKAFQVALEAMDHTDKVITEVIAKPEPEVKAESAEDPTSAQSVDHMQTANTSAQGQSEPDPTVKLAYTIHASTVTESGPAGGVNEPHPFGEHGGGMSQPITSWPTTPAQPYLGQNYFDWPAYVPHDQWIAGGGTEHDYWTRR